MSIPGSRLITPLALVLVVGLGACGRVPDHGGGAAIDSQTCWQCHGDRYLAAQQPNHVTAALPQTCASCHSTLSWRPAEAGDHDRYWPLTGQHQLASCASCHVNDVFAGTPRQCVGCHQDDYAATTDPNHVAANYPTTCEGCHDTAAWKPASFDHQVFWPIDGKHTAVACATCHKDEVYQGTPRTCEGCHLPDYQATLTPNHVSAAFPTACAGCHTTAGWTPASFGAHDQYWPLEGQHVEATCASCHVNEVYAGTPRTCEGCHMPAYQQSTDPNHAALGYPTTCATCHNAGAWRPADYRGHDAFWPLEGKHIEATCTSCHTNGVYAGTPRTCEGCHMPDYQQSTNPNHVADAFPTACAGCHTAQAWRPADFGAHDDYWPLEGKHEAATCASCHQNNVYAGTPRECVGCHRAAYDQATTPDHVGAGFPTTCETCHGVLGWQPSTFDHEATFPLRGAHIEAQCASCHQNNVYAGTARTCNGCHQPDYQAATNPSHTQLSLSTNCQTCHNETAWATNTFPGHDPLFRISSGAHSRFGCTDCHKSSATAWEVFTCTGCHTGEHALARMNAKHADENGYAQTLTTYGTERGCLHCHPDGND